MAQASTGDWALNFNITDMISDVVDGYTYLRDYWFTEREYHLQAKKLHATNKAGLEQLNTGNTQTERRTVADAPVASSP